MAIRGVYDYKLEAIKMNNANTTQLATPKKKCYTAQKPLPSEIKIVM